MGLIAGVLEERGIRSVCLSTFAPIMEQVRPPRWLDVPFPLGYPLGRAGDAELQTRILRSALELLEEAGPGPIRRQFSGEDHKL